MRICCLTASGPGLQKVPVTHLPLQMAAGRGEGDWLSHCHCCSAWEMGDARPPSSEEAECRPPSWAVLLGGGRLDHCSLSLGRFSADGSKYPQSSWLRGTKRGLARMQKEGQKNDTA